MRGITRVRENGRWKRREAGNDHLGEPFLCPVVIVFFFKVPKIRSSRGESRRFQMTPGPSYAKPPTTVNANAITLSRRRVLANPANAKMEVELGHRPPRPCVVIPSFRYPSMPTRLCAPHFPESVAKVSIFRFGHGHMFMRNFGLRPTLFRKAKKESSSRSLTRRSPPSPCNALDEVLRGVRPTGSRNFMSISVIPM